jgi:hypothetical protein
MAHDEIIVQPSLFDPIEIPLTKGYVALVNLIDADLLKFRWSAATYRSGDTYARRSAYPNGRRGKMKNELMHRVILERILERPIAHADLCDHVDGNPLNNCRENLRLATYSQNMQNKRRSKNNLSGYKGVSHVKGNSWIAKRCVNGEKIYLGCFSSPQAAYEAYCDAARKYFGEFARTE